MDTNLTLGQRFAGLILDRQTGRVVGSKLAAVAGHLLMSVFFVYHNIQSGFNVDLWFDTLNNFKGSLYNPID